MTVTIERVSGRRGVERFIRFGHRLYSGHPYAVPDLREDLRNTFDPHRNPAYEFCEAQLFLALREGKCVGRVAAIINRRANEAWGKKSVRFGWIDFVDDTEVSAALLKEVERWGRERGMTTVEGPLGFTDMDAEGMLVEGFDRIGTMATIYNYPYYPRHMERLGFAKDADWVELLIKVPPRTPEKMQRVADIVSRKYGLRIKKFTRRELTKGGYGQRIFDLINECFAPLYGYSQMSPRQIEEYIRTYLPLLDLRMVTGIVDAEGQLIGVGISMPSLARALQRARGRLFPWGWIPLAWAMYVKRSKVLDLLLVGIKPEYQNKGVNAMLFADLVPIYNRMGFTHAESNVELETNHKVQAQWDYFETEQHKRRRAYTRPIGLPWLDEAEGIGLNLSKKEE